MDDTGWRQENERSVMWIANTPELAFFEISKRKDGATALELLGGHYDGILVTDRAQNYNFHPQERCQFCWAHGDRHFNKISQREGLSCDVGEWAMEDADAVFTLWRKFKDGGLPREQLREKLTPVKARLLRALHFGAECGHRRTERTCANLLKRFECLWLFAEHDGVEPTNNSSERGLRRGVLWRKVSFGSQSERGSAFVARFLTTMETCRRQGRELVDHLVQCVDAWLTGESSPSLVSTPP